MVVDEGTRQIVDVLEMIVSSGAGIALAFFLVGRDERRLSEREAERAWPIASKRAALVVFTLIALPLHFLRTRRSFKGLALAVGSVLAFLALDIAIGTTFDTFFN